MTTLTRRHAGFLGLAAAFAASSPSRAQDAPKELRIGYQKTGLPVVARQRGTIETRLAGQGTAVRWVEFTAGPPLLEAMNAGAVDAGWTGDAPPIFAQAAGAAVVYVAALPSNGAGEALIVKAGSPFRVVADLKGRKVAVTKGSSAHNLLLAALEGAGLAWADITPVYLSPADAAAAFGRDAVDAWTIWDPFLAITQSRGEIRLLATSKGVLEVNTFFLANKGFASRNARTLDLALEGLGEAAAWAAANRSAVARTLADVTGVELSAQTVAADRTEFGVQPMADAVVANQQITADRFFRVGLIPRAVAVRDAVWIRPQS